jgi:hypothetical protein
MVTDTRLNRSGFKMATDVRMSTYGNYSSGNYGAHCMRLEIGTLALYFSYQTVIAFDDGHGTKVRKNSWSSTTGKHLNAIDGGNKKERLSPGEFEQELNAVLKSHKLVVP